ncbi:MAG: hypothetical protein KDA48_07150 [Amphiplicatus sp.]|nr:hypothetical protein [Amphiplicatus sp.]
MSEQKPDAKPTEAIAPGTEARPLLAFLNRHRLKLLGVLIALALGLMLVDAVLKGSAY